MVGAVAGRPYRAHGSTATLVHQDLRIWLMASCETLDQADEAAARGWRAAALLPRDHEGTTFRTPEGRAGVLCPWDRDGTTCNTCRMCSVWEHPEGPVIGFRQL